jgi:polyprenyl-phospho-N-acetylgalactosaminyl synthase
MKELEEVNMNTLVVIPTYNEDIKIYNVVKSVLGLGYSVVVVDDGSSDNTSSEAQKAGVKVLSHYVNRGYGAALETGNQYAIKNRYDIIVHFDGDGQHTVDEIKHMIAPIARGDADVIIGSRFLKDNTSVPIVRAGLIKLAIWFTWLVSGFKMSDAHNGFRAFSSKALRKIECRQDGMSYASEVIDQVAEHNLRIGEVPVTIKYTDYSKAKGESNIKKVLLGLRFLWGKVIK